jgi:hypothetical protein
LCEELTARGAGAAGGRSVVIADKEGRKMVKAKWLMVAIVACVALAAVVAVTWAAAQAEAPAPQGFSIREVRFDESESGKGSKPLPIIPRSWRFVGVSNGEKVNSNILWFQDRDGHIYGVSGFTTTTDELSIMERKRDQFILIETINKITAGD